MLARSRRALPSYRCRRYFVQQTAGGVVRDGLPVKRGLYDPSFEKDSCGVGFVVDIKGAKTHTVVEQAVQAIAAMDHRGAAGADALSGDGVGLLTQLPHLFFRKKLADKGIQVGRDTDLAVGVLFLPGRGSGYADEGTARAIQDVVERVCSEARLDILLWRKVPIGEYALGEGARATLPDIRQVILCRPHHLRSRGDAAFDAAADDAFERLLYVTRKRLEVAVSALSGGSIPFYIPSFSHRTLVYKGLVIAPNLRRLFPDLVDSDYQSAIGLFHQRYSTNTFPMWYSAQPFRMLAHNGEINTLNGNLNWMKMREETLHSPLFPANAALKDLLPIVQPGGSDSAALDNVLELLVQGGRSPLQAMAMLVPPAYENDKTMDGSLRAFYEYQRTLMEPWDGPAALCFTDGRTIACAMDRNGLRPLRYWLTESGKLIAASEVGIVNVPTETVVERGRLGPGDMLAVDTVAGTLMKNKEIKTALAARRPYGNWLERSINLVGGGGGGGVGGGGKASAAGDQALSYKTILNVLQPQIAVAAAAEAAAAAVGGEGGGSPPPLPLAPSTLLAQETRVRIKKAFGYSKEDEELVLKPMMDSAHEPIGSMGDDTPIAAFSARPQLLYRYLKQRFAEVTNPPIDPLLERHAMSSTITFGRKGSLLSEDAHASFLVRLPSPIVTEAQLGWLLSQPNFPSITVPVLWAVEGGAGGLEAALRALCQRVEAAVDGGTSYILLSDRGVDAQRAPIPMLLAVGAVHHHLIRVGKRMRASLLVETGEAREDHHMAALISYGASLVHPYLAFETVAELAQKAATSGGAGDEEGEVAGGGGSGSVASSSTSSPPMSIETALTNYRTALVDGLLRILSKMGICTVDSYRGSQSFEILGLHDDVVKACFAGTSSRLSGVTFEGIGRDVLAFHAAGFQDAVEYKRGSALPRSGAYSYVKGGEFHAYNPIVFNKLRVAAQAGGGGAEASASAGSNSASSRPGFDVFKKFAAEVDARPLTNIRDTLDYVRAATPTPLAEVESADSIVKRFSTQAMSHGSISREAHEALAIAANRIGARSNTGEGGEDPGRYSSPYTEDRPDLSLSPTSYPRRGDNANSRIKQVASARFGVTPAYLVQAEQLEIKMAQGSKPGEGGHIPGHKVNAEIASNRYAVKGVTLISPPPHHDIYSIEDLAQLIYDLKRVNQAAQVVVKLVSTMGVGTIAAGVAKAYADVVQISGNDGGTGASPLSSIKNAGLNWELGLAEAQQVLVANGLRERVTLRVDGGLKDGRDVALGALLGAEQFGFGTAALVALGCVMARKCHLNTCPVGIATQDPALRAKFKGLPEHVVTFLLHTAEQTRRIISEMGLRTLDDLVGRTDLLALKEKALYPKGPVDVRALLVDPDPTRKLPRKALSMASRSDPDKGRAYKADGIDLDETVWTSCRTFLDARLEQQKRGANNSGCAEKDAGSNAAATIVQLQFPITNAARSVGARLSGEIARRFGNAGLASPATSVKDTATTAALGGDDAGAAATTTTPAAAAATVMPSLSAVTPDPSIILTFHGVAGQSFGAFNSHGVKLILRGEAHDYVGKSMHGGTITLAPQAVATTTTSAVASTSASTSAAAAAAAASSSASIAEAAPNTNVIAGNTVLYGATGGRLFANGRAGERFAVRNSGATAVVEGIGDNGCEYMTNGCVVILGPTGRNFAAGMSGGRAFVLDQQDAFLDRYNPGMVDTTRITADSPEDVLLRSLLEEHTRETGSPLAARLLANWDAARAFFWHIVPNTRPAQERSQALVHVPLWSGPRAFQSSPTPNAPIISLNLRISNSAATAASASISSKHFSTASSSSASSPAAATAGASPTAPASSS